MKEENQTFEKNFLIVGFSDLPHLKVPLFVAFLLIYLLTLAGNLLIMVTVYSNSQLHTPMYFFLTNLSFSDICYVTVSFPQMLAHFFLEGTQVSLAECLVQVYFFLVMVTVGYSLLSVIALDRYVAICKPLHYMSIMNMTVCIWLAAGTWELCFIIILPHTVLISMLSYCDSHTTNHFFCDITALMKLSCSRTHTIETLTYVVSAIVTLLCFLLIIISYINIASFILKIKSKVGRHKAFSTCASHLTVVVLFFGSICGTYVRPASTYSVNKISSLSYIGPTPLCNPIKYTLKNTEFKNALKKTKNRQLTIGRAICSLL